MLLHGPFAVGRRLIVTRVLVSARPVSANSEGVPTEAEWGQAVQDTIFRR